MKEHKILKIMIMVAILCWTIVLSGKKVSAENGATGISVNTPVYGSIEDKGDENWYSFSSNIRGYFTVSFKLTDVTSEAEYHLKVYDADRRELCLRRYQSAAETIIISNEIGATFYVEMEKANNYIGEYELKVNFTADSNWETEYNDTEATANLLAINQTITGTINNPGNYSDVDFYKISLKNNCIVNVDFALSDISGARYFYIYLYNSKGEEIKLAGYCNEGIHRSYYLAKGNYFVKVSSNDDNDCTPYVIKYNTKKISSVKTPSIKKAIVYSGVFNTYLSQIKLSKNAKNADLYEVKVSGQKNMKKPVLTTTADATKNLTKFSSTEVGRKGSYYVQVRPCIIDAYGKKIYTGKKSNVVKAKFSK